MDLEAPYPNPLTDAQAQRLVEQRMQMGWLYPKLGHREYADAVETTKRRVRLKMWLKAMGIKVNHPSHEERMRRRGKR